MAPRGDVLRLTGLLGATVGFSASLTYTISLLSPFLVTELGLSVAEVGFLSSAVFFAAAASGSWLGHLSDRLSYKKAILSLFGTTTFVQLAFASSPSFVWMFPVAFLGGAVMSASNPVTNKAIAERFAIGSRGVVIGWKQAGVPAVGFLLGVALPRVAALHGWRIAAASVAVVTALLVPVSHFLLRSHKDIVARSPQPTALAPLERRSLRHLGLYAFLMGGGGSVVLVHYPLFATLEVEMSAEVAGSAIALMSIVGAGARVIWVRLAERLHATDYVMIALALISFVATILVARASPTEPWLIWASCLLSGFGVQAWNGVGMLKVLDLVDTHQIGWASGYLMRMYYGGLLATPAIFGVAVERTGGYGWPWACLAALFLLAGITAAGRLRSDQNKRPLQP